MVVGTADVSARLEGLLSGLVDGTIPPEMDASAEAKPYLDDLLSRVDTYRDAAHRPRVCDRRRDRC